MTAPNSGAVSVDPVAIRVALPTASHEVVIGTGVMADAGRWIGALAGAGRTAIITDRAVAKLHLPTLRGALDAAGIAHVEIVLPQGERTKDFAHLEDLTDRLLAARIERGDLVLALGGGVVGDLAGVAASILRRGVGVVQLPTTLTAQVDSAIGGKTAINSAHGKNLIGTFHHPRLVLADVALLATLPARELRAGYAEVAKYGVLGDRDFFAWLEGNAAALIGGDVAARVHAVRESVRAKVRIVAEDPRETGARAHLNLGHTFAHAFEAAAGYGGGLLHGEAVAVGMVLALDLSVRLGLCPPADVARVRRHLTNVGLPTVVAALATPDWTADSLIAHMAQDKKVQAGKPAFVLVRGIGEALVSREVGLDTVHALLAEGLAAAPEADRERAARAHG
jgi:3-dehydroquinate synthase